MAYEEVKLEGLYWTVERPYGRWKKLNKETGGRKFIPDTLQPLFRISEEHIGNGKYWITAKFAKFVPVDAWKQFPWYSKHTINHLR